MKKTLRCLNILLMLVFFAVPTQAQKGSLRGQVVNEEQVPVALANVMLDKAREVKVSLDGMGAKAVKTATGSILTSKKINDYNDFEHPDVVKPQAFNDAKVKKNTLTVKIPAKSIVVLNLK